MKNRYNDINDVVCDNVSTNINMHLTDNDVKPVLFTVHLGTMIVAENTLFKVVKKYNDFVWRLKSENGEIVNLFYTLSQSWTLHSK
jgi:hypothetical protein